MVLLAKLSLVQQTAQSLWEEEREKERETSVYELVPTDSYDRR